MCVCVCVCVWARASMLACAYMCKMYVKYFEIKREFIMTEMNNK